MCSLDDQLQDLFGHTGPPPDRFEGDITAVHRTVRRRKATRRAMATSLSVLALAGVGLVWGKTGHYEEVIIGDTTTEPSDPTTSSTTPTTRSTATSTPATPTTSTTNPPPPARLTRDYDLRSAVFRPPCPNDNRTVTLEDGRAELRLSPDPLPKYVVELGPVVYADFSGDNNEDALVLLRCEFAGASTEHYGSLQALEVDADGVLTPMGPTRQLLDVYAAEASGTTLTVVREIYKQGDARCCPSSAVRERWSFDDNRFVLVDSTPTTTPNTPKP